MAPAPRARNLRPRHPQRPILDPVHGAGDGVEVGRPAAAGLELVRRAVQGRGAGGAGVGAVGRHVLVVGARVGGFGALVADDGELGGGEEGAPFGVGFLDFVGGHGFFCAVAVAVGGEEGGEGGDAGHAGGEKVVVVGAEGGGCSFCCCCCCCCCEGCEGDGAEDGWEGEAHVMGLYGG